MKKNIPFIVLLLSLFFVVLLPQARAQDATLFFAPASGSFGVGKTFSVVVSVNSGGNPGINAAGATINFDKAKLSVVSAIRDKSIFNLWITEPTYSNADGTVKFDGGSPSAYTGTNGNLITITFRALTDGEATLTFSNASVLAADGKGTNVLKNSQSAVLTLQKVVAPPPPPPPQPPPSFTGSIPAVPKIASPTHPDENTWYKDKNPKFTWTLSPDITTVRLLIDHAPDSVPTITYSEKISERQLKDLDDGTWFFHVQLKNGAGWGGIGHRKALIDTGPPFDFLPTVVIEGQTIYVTLDAIDDVSGIEHYELAIDDKEPIRASIADIVNKKYALSRQEPGNHTAVIAAVDKVGNRKEATAAFAIAESSPSVQKPAIVEDADDDRSSWWAAFVGSPYGIYVIGGSGALFAAFLFLIVRSRIMKKKLKRTVAAAKKEAEEVKMKTSNIFAALHDEIKEQIQKIGGDASGGEKGQKEIVETLEGALEISEDLIQKEVEDVERALEE